MEVIIIDTSKIWSTGILQSLNDKPVYLRAQIHFNENYQTIITIFEINNDYVELIKDCEYCCAVLVLDQGGYLSLFDLLIQQEVGSVDDIDHITLTLITTNVIKGNKAFQVDSTFDEFTMEITDGYELIGSCPYDVNTNYMNIVRGEAINIPINISPIVADTILGVFRFYSVPAHKLSSSELSLHFKQRIHFKSVTPITVREFSCVLRKILDFFTLLCGELVTINRLILEESINDSYMSHEFIGFCNYPRTHLHLLQGNGLDSTSFLRVSLFKISDFSDIGSALDFWFTHANSLSMAHKSFERILLDEDVKIVTENKFLAAMQLIEGYSSAFSDNSENLSEFNEKKAKIISQISNKEEKEFLEHNLTFTGTTFRKSVTKFLLEGVQNFERMSNSAFSKNNDKLVGSIVNERNLYTHSSNRINQSFNFLEIVNIASICKSFYRANMLKKLGIPQELIKKRFSHDRFFVAYLEKFFSIKMSPTGNLSGFDKAMWHFSDSTIQK